MLGRKNIRRRRGICRVAKAKPRVQGKRSAITTTVAEHARLLQPLRLQGLWKWRHVPHSVQDAGVPLQTGTVAVERWWSSLKQMPPNEARCVSSRWFQVLARLAFLHHNIRRFQAGSTVPWADGDHFCYNESNSLKTARACCSKLMTRIAIQFLRNL